MTPHRSKLSRVIVSCTHPTPHLSVTGSSDGGVLLCSVQRCSSGRSSQNKQQEESVPLAHSCDLFHLSLSFTLIPTVCQVESWLPFMEQPSCSTALETMSQVFHCLGWLLLGQKCQLVHVCLQSTPLVTCIGDKKVLGHYLM